MDDEAQRTEANQGSLGTRGPEVGVAAFLVLMALMVIADSLRVGISWADEGPRAGYFPFYIGLILLGSSGTVLVTTLLRWRKTTSVFADHSQLRTVFAMLVPMVIYVGGIAWLGIYLASFALIGYFMRRYGKFSWGVTGAVSVIVPIVFFLTFERWFLVPLPKGPIEHLLGF